VNHFPRLAACAIAGGLLVGSLGHAAAQTTPTPDRRPTGPTAGASAPAATAPVSLAAALDAAWQRAVAARESEGQRRRADAERSAAGALWAAPPALELSHRNDRWQRNIGSRETEVGVAVPLWLPGQRAARRAAADAALSQAGAAERAARLHLAGELREAAWSLSALAAEAAQGDGQAAALAQLLADVERRVRAGDLARADALAAEAELLAARAQQAEVLQRMHAVRTRWRLLTGMTAMPDTASPGAADASTAAPPAVHPELEHARQSTEQAKKRLDLLRQSRRDAPELTLGVRQDVPDRAEPTQNSLVVGLRLPFGTDDRNRPLETAALGELDVAQTAQQRLSERLEAEQAAAREALRSAQTQADSEAARARLLRERANLIDKSFRAGETPLPDLLRALAAAAQAENAVARQTAALGLARARLQQALGILP
jgi:outer membrane protein, heavy metal efflux system